MYITITLKREIIKNNMKKLGKILIIIGIIIVAISFGYIAFYLHFLVGTAYTGIALILFGAALLDSESFK